MPYEVAYKSRFQGRTFRVGVDSGIRTPKWRSDILSPGEHDAAKLARVAQPGMRYEPSVKLQFGPFQASKPTVCTIGSRDPKLVDEEFLSLLRQRYISTERGARIKCREHRVRRFADSVLVVKKR